MVENAAMTEEQIVVDEKQSATEEKENLTEMVSVVFTPSQVAQLKEIANAEGRKLGALIRRRVVKSCNLE